MNCFTNPFLIFNMLYGGEHMTIHEYLNYPMGKGSAVAFLPDAKQNMAKRYMIDEPHIKYTMYNTGKTIIFHMEMPSESTRGVMYDVILEFPYTDADLCKGNNLSNFPFKVFSNCPSFIYSYAYIFNQHNLICDWLIHRYDKKTLLTPPKTRNPFGIIFYEKSIFYAVYYMQKNLNLSLVLLTKSAVKMSHTQIKGRISSQTDIKKSTEYFKEENKLKKAIEKAQASPSDKDKLLISATERRRGIRFAHGPKKPKSSTSSTKLPKKPR